MYCYHIGDNLSPQETLLPEEPGVILLTSEELARQPELSGLEGVLRHAPAARDARVCKAEVRGDCLTGTLILPRVSREGARLAFGYLLTGRRLVLVDDTQVLLSHLRRLAKEGRWGGEGPGKVFCGLLEELVAKDLHHLEELEDQAESLEDRVLSGELEGFSVAMTALRKQAMAWFRYYDQMDDAACVLRENENGFFSPAEQRLFRIFEERVTRLGQEAQLLREYCLQIQTLCQAEIDIRQNRTMKTLTIVTTIFLPLSLLAGWYGMNFAYMPELRWKYGYPAVIGVSLLIILGSLWLWKKKKR